MRRGNWYTLDNTAKLMPSTTNNLNTNVFRLACTLKENVDPNLLQEALNAAVEEFPLFTYTMKDGIFWHYLEKSNIKPIVEEETKSPCARIDSGLLFRLSYYKMRINLEVYHVLSDGNGAMEFLKYIVCTYLSLKYNIETSEPINESSAYEKESDDFKKFDKSNYKIMAKSFAKAYKFKFQKKNDTCLDIIEAHMSVKDVKNEAKKYDTTVTIYLTAILIKNIIRNARVRDLKKPIGIALPVDLRHIFPSKTSRNFFYTITVQYKSNGVDDLNDIITSLKQQFEERLSKEYLQNLLNTFMIIQKIIFIRLIPNFLKDWLLSYISKIGKKGQSITLSNLGVIKIPKEYENHIAYFTPLMSCEDIQLTVASYKDELVLGFTSHIVNKELERNIIKDLQKITSKEIKIYSNMVGEKDEM